MEDQRHNESAELEREFDKQLDKEKADRKAGEEHLRKPVNIAFKGDKLEERKKSENRPRLLCLDGGGMRGVITIEFLKEIERQTGKKIGDIFDLICGTSTGGLIGATAIYKAASCEEIENMYKIVGEDVFSRSSLSKTSNVSKENAQFSAHRFENILKQIVGVDTPLGSIQYPYFFVLATDFTNPHNAVPYLFSNYGAQTKDVSLWQALRATSAATLYFREFVMGNRTYQDGGLQANNPTYSAMNEAWELWGEDPKMTPSVIVSIGTGLFEGKDVPPKLNKTISDVASETARELVAKATDTEGIHRQVDQRVKQYHSADGTQYFRLNVTMPDAFDLDEIDPKKLELLKELARTYIKEHPEVFEKLKDALV